MKLGQSVTTIPTVGFNVETVNYKNVKFNVWVSISTKTVQLILESCAFLFLFLHCICSLYMNHDINYIF